MKIGNTFLYSHVLISCPQFYMEEDFIHYLLLIGLEKERKGHCFSFDAIGSFEKNKFCSAGKGQSVADVILDSKMACSTMTFLIEDLIFLKKLFVSVSYRGVTTGDGLQIFVLTKKGDFN